VVSPPTPAPEEFASCLIALVVGSVATATGGAEAGRADEGEGARGGDEVGVVDVGDLLGREFAVVVVEGGDRAVERGDGGERSMVVAAEVLTPPSVPSLPPTQPVVLAESATSPTNSPLR
jgi:hypothetical protein